MDRNGEKDSGEIEKGIVDAGFCRPMIVDDVSPPRRAQYRSGFGKKAKHGLLVPEDGIPKCAGSAAQGPVARSRMAGHGETIPPRRKS